MDVVVRTSLIVYILPYNLGVKSTVYTYYGRSFGYNSGTPNLNVGII